MCYNIVIIINDGISHQNMIATICNQIVERHVLVRGLLPQKGLTHGKQSRIIRTGQ